MSSKSENRSQNKQNSKNPCESRFQQAGEWRQTLIQTRSSTVMCRPGFSSSRGHEVKVERCIEDEEESTDDRILTDLQVAFTAGDA